MASALPYQSGPESGPESQNKLFPASVDAVHCVRACQARHWVGNKDCVTTLYHLLVKKKGWNSNEAFQAAEKSGYWGVLDPLVCTLDFATLQTIYMHKKLHNTLKEREI